MAQLLILSKNEISNYELPPIFSALERKQYFQFSENTNVYIESIRSDVNKLGYILQCSYFLRSRKFYQTEEFRHADAEFILLDRGLTCNLKDYKRSTRNRHKSHILETYGWNSFGPNEKTMIVSYVNLLTKSELNPKYLFREMSRYIYDKRIERISYWMLVEIISNALTDRETILADTIKNYFPKTGNMIISELLRDDSIENIDDRKKSNFKISYFKNINKNLEPSVLSQNVEKLVKLKLYFNEFKSLIHAIDLNFNGFKFFSEYVSKSKVSQLKQLSDEKRQLYVVSFIYVSYYYLNDLLTSTFLREVQTNQNSTQRHYDEFKCIQRDNDAKMSNSVFSDIKDIVFPLQDQVHHILKTESMGYKERVIKALEVFDLGSDRVLNTGRNVDKCFEHTNEILSKRDKYLIQEKQSLKLIGRVAKIILHLEFEYKSSNAFLTSAIRYFKNNNGLIDKYCPQGFLKSSIRDILYRENGTFRHLLYKSLLFETIAKALKGGSLNIKHSSMYIEIEDFLIPEKEINQENSNLLALSGLENHVDFTKELSDLTTSLDVSYALVNDNILNGVNKHIHFNDNGKFILKTEKVEKEDDFKVSSLIPENYIVNITELLNSVDTHSNFSKAFVHYSSKYAKNNTSKEALIATVIALGCGIGLGKMQKISSSLSENLDYLATVQFSVANLQTANNCVLKIIDRMPLSKIYMTNAKSHTSSDGANFGVTNNTLDSSPTYKHMGTTSAVSIYMFTDQSHKMWYSTVINASEREAHYVIDGLMENEVVQSDIHSTDTHGYSEIIFATTYLLGFRFAPRIKNLKKQRVYTLSDKNQYMDRGYKLLPQGNINVVLIKKYWPMILRFVATIKLKRATASDIFRRLNSFSLESPFHQALKEYGRIIKTGYILDYVNNHEFRQSIEKQLNKVESIQKFSRAILVTGKYDFSSNIREEQLLMEGAKRLIQNSILCWNYMYLSKMIHQVRTYKEKEKLKSIIKNGSPIFWKHINLLGNYDFGDASIRCKLNYDFRALEKIKI